MIENNNLLQLRKKLKELKLDALLITSVPNIIYLTNYSGFSKDEREAYLFITKNKQYIITDARYSEAVRTNIKDHTLLEISSKNPIHSLIQQVIQKHNINRVGFEENNITYSEYQKLKKELFLPPRRSELKLENTQNIVEDLRIIKTADEIATIKKACEIGDKAFKFVLNKIKKGVTEKELAFELELFIKKNHADLSFPSIVAFGKNAAIPHHQTGNSKLIPHNSVLFDFGVKTNNYCSDMTRTVFFGKATSQQKKMYQTVLEAQQKAIDFLASSFERLASSSENIAASKIDSVAREHILQQGYPTIPHSLGHGIGIEVHEKPSLSPKSKDVLKKGMVFSIEPGIYKNGFGGVRIEDLVVLEKSGLRILTKSPKTLIEL